MHNASGARGRLVLAVAALLSLLLAACSGGALDVRRAPSNVKGVKGGTLRVVNLAGVDSLDPGDSYGRTAWSLMRLYARTLYSWDSTRQGERITDPVPDLAVGLPEPSADRRTYTFRVRPGVAWAQPLEQRSITADDFVYAVQRQVAHGHIPKNPYLGLIEGVDAFAEGRAGEISGWRAVDAQTLQVRLTRPAPDLLSILSLPFFAPVPRGLKGTGVLGDGEGGYGRQVVGSGPYTLETYGSGSGKTKTITFVRNRHWDAAADPLRRAWVDEVEVRVVNDGDPAVIQRLLERQDADVNGDAIPPPNEDLPRLAKDPRLQPRLGIHDTGCIRYLTLQTDDGPTADPLVRQAVNWAVDKEELTQRLGGSFAGTPASTVLTPPMDGYRSYDLYPSPGGHGDVDRARELLRRAGHPDGITLTYVGQSTGQGPAVTESLRTALARAGITLKVRAYPGEDRYRLSLRRTDKKAEHQLGYASWCPDWPGDGARSFLVALLDGRTITPVNNNNYGDYDNPRVNRLIDQALDEPDRDARKTLWAAADRQVMTDAAWVPLVYDRQTFFWAQRVKNWRYSPWVANADYANLWLDPYKP